MKVIVMGAGAIGVTSAYFLARRGCQVTVLERNSAAAAECSYKNGGQLSFSHVEPFSSKNSTSLILKSFFNQKSFLCVDNYFEKKNLRFFFDFLSNYGDKKSNVIAQKLFSLGQKSRLAFSRIMTEENIDFNYVDKGILHFYRSEKLFKKALKQAKFQISLGDKIEILDAKNCLKKEPGLIKLYDEGNLYGGIFHENDANGDANLFTQKLAEICTEKYGVKFEYDNEIKNIFTNREKITGVNTDKNVYVADSYVCTLGAHGNKLLNGVEVDSKILAIAGYSISVECADNDFAPKIGLTDPENKIVYSRLDNILRAAGTIEISDSNSYNKKLLDFLKNRVNSDFAHFENTIQFNEWRGYRPFRANSTPLICKSQKYGNLFLNSGHGNLGWTMSCGSGDILSEIILDRKVFDYDA